jgi:hypothetical protein
MIMRSSMAGSCCHRCDSPRQRWSRRVELRRWATSLEQGTCANLEAVVSLRFEAWLAWYVP